MKKDRSKLHDELDQAARPDEDHASQERNAGLAIAVLALVVVGLPLPSSWVHRTRPALTKAPTAPGRVPHPRHCQRRRARARGPEQQLADLQVQHVPFRQVHAIRPQAAWSCPADFDHDLPL
jgi:hypothetical protein